jgi:putative Mg2+ transporter-C (MgtC) family protein
MFLSSEDALKLLFSLLAGGLVGLEREFRDKAAGFRTLIFISLGATMFTIFSAHLGGLAESTRIAANIVVGVGFLGAGVILREHGRVTGLTTASTIWLTAAIGMGIGGGFYALTGLAVAVALVVLELFPWLEHRMDRFWMERTYEITCPLRWDKLSEFRFAFEQSDLRVVRAWQMKAGDERMICSLQANGPLRAHEKLVERLFGDAEVIEFKF